VAALHRVLGHAARPQARLRRRAHTWLAVGVEGIAPYRFKVVATGYVGDDGRLSARLKAAYDLRSANRLILVPSIESNVYSKAEDERGLGAGLANIEVGLRLRYELHRKFAPYAGYVWEPRLRRHCLPQP